ncbi:MAG TPA: hypothetical protein VFI30_08860 [Nocardioidaceae bacterium]|nr:hypothetical protein [Nocardioidaceae bacterium]
MTITHKPPISFFVAGLCAAILALLIPIAAARGDTQDPRVKVSPPSGYHFVSVSYVLNHVKGRSLGPSWKTSYGRLTITGFRHPNRYWYPKRKVTYGGSPIAIRSGAAADRPADASSESDGTAYRLLGRSYQPRAVSYQPGAVSYQPLGHWWAPWTWNWRAILGTFWNSFMSKCLSGAIRNIVGVMSGTLIVNLLARAGKVFIGPYGYAALAVGGCIVNLAFP